MMPRSEKRLDAFTQAYIEAALWSTNDESDESGGEPLDKNYSIEDIAPETMELIVEDCADFQERYGDLLSESGIDDARAGHDFWLSREDHGSGFFDEESIDEEFRDPLQEAAQSYGGFDLYVGDPDEDGDRLIYGPPPDWYRSHHHRGNVERLTGKPANPPALKERTTVRDFNTRDELIDHARGEGATHVVVVGSGATLYFPTQGGKYEEARAWRQNGYWHAPAPGTRKVVDSLPRDAQPIGGARRAAEASSREQPWVPPALASEITPAMLEVLLNGVGDHAKIRPGQSVVLDRDGYAPLRDGGYIVLKRATPGLSSYGDYYVLTDKGADLWRRYRLESRKVGGAAREPHHRVRDYVPVDTRGRPLSGPTKDYSAAKREADQAGGFVKFTTNPPDKLSEAWGRNTLSDWQILDAIGKGQQVPPESEARAVKLAQLGFIDTRGAWQLTAKGRRAIEQRVPVAAEAKRSGRSRKTNETAMQIAGKLAEEVGGNRPKPIEGGFRWSEPNESAMFTTYSHEHDQKVVVVVSVFKDGSAALNFFSDESLSETATYENIAHFTYGPGGFTSHQVDIKQMVEDINWVRTTVDGYAASWQQPNADVDESRRPRGRRSTRRTPQSSRRRPARRR